MKWNTPKIIDTAVGMEINCYACAVLQVLGLVVPFRLSYYTMSHVMGHCGKSATKSLSHISMGPLLKNMRCPYCGEKLFLRCRSSDEARECVRTSRITDNNDGES